MLYAFIGLVEVLCVVVTLAPLRAGATCTPATHRMRVAFGVVCALLCAYSFVPFVRLVILGDHPINAIVVVGRIVAATFGVQAWVLIRSVRLSTPVAVALAAVCAALAIAAFVHAASA